MGEAPVLVHGKKKLSQSGVILTYLARKSGKFLPQGEDEELESLRWIIFDNQKVNGFLGPFRFLKNFAPKPGDPAVMAFMKARIDASLAIVNKRLTGRQFLVSDKPTIADISLTAISIIRRRSSASISPRSIRRSAPGRSHEGAARLEASLRSDARLSVRDAGLSQSSDREWMDGRWSVRMIMVVLMR